MLTCRQCHGQRLSLGSLRVPGEHVLLRWLPDGLPVPSVGLLRYAYRAMVEADAWSRPAIESMLRTELLASAQGSKDSLLIASPNQAPNLPWTNPGFGEPMLVLLDDVQESLDRQSLKEILLRHSPLLSYPRAQLTLWLEDPALTCKLGYWCSVRMARLHGTQSLEFSRAIAIVAIGSLGMQLQRRCERCFRQALPTLKRCAEHSQSDDATSDGGVPLHQRRANARAAEKVMRALGDIGEVRDLRAAVRARASQLAGAIFNRPIGSAVEWRAQMSSALRASPTITELLPTELDLADPGKVLKTLRKNLDPLERDPWVWPEKIKLADVWLKGYRKVAPGSPPTGARQKTTERIQLAISLLASGHSRHQIAQQLGMSVRALQLMLNRHAPNPSN